MARRRDLRGKVVVIVGASSGLGRATALALADHATKLTLVARRRDALDRVAESAVGRFGRVDVWVHAASMLIVGDLERHPTDETSRLVDTNVLGCLNGARTALRVFRSQREGVLILVSSMLGLLPNPLAPAYVASRFATRGLGLSLRHAVAGDPDIHVGVIMPGPATPGDRGLDQPHDPPRTSACTAGDGVRRRLVVRTAVDGRW